MGAVAGTPSCDERKSTLPRNVLHCAHSPNGVPATGLST